MFFLLLLKLSRLVVMFFHLCSTNKLIIPESICHSSFLLQAARIYKNLTDTRKKLKWLRSLGNQTVIIWSKGTLDRIKKIELKRPWLHNIITICSLIIFSLNHQGSLIVVNNPLNLQKNWLLSISLNLPYWAISGFFKSFWQLFV